MKLFPEVPGQSDSTRGKPGKLGSKMLMMVILAMVVGGLMWNFFDQGKEKYEENVDAGVPVVVQPVEPQQPVDQAGKQPVDQAGKQPVDQAGKQPGNAEDFDPLGLGIGRAEFTLQPFVEKPEVLLEVASRDRTDGAERRGTIHEPGIVYLAHKLRSDNAAGKPPAEPLLSTIKDDKLFSALYERPDLYRGKLVELRGNVIRMEKGRRALEWVAVPGKSNPLDTPRLFRSYVLDENKKIHLVYTIEDQVAQLVHMDKVILRAYFCRLFTGDNEKGKATIPILVASGYEKMESSESGSSGVEIMKLGIMVVLGVGVLSGIIILLVNRRSEASYRVRLKQARDKASAKD